MMTSPFMLIEGMVWYDYSAQERIDILLSIKSNMAQGLEECKQYFWKEHVITLQRKTTNRKYQMLCA